MLTELAAEIHQDNVAAGWWDEYLPDRKHERTETAMMLIVSELSEAMEGHRKGLMDDHLPAEKMFDVELADAMIRMLDLAGALGITVNDDPALVDIIKVRLANKPVPAQLYGIVMAPLGLNIYRTIAVAEMNNVDLWRLVAAKRAYNRNRADHKRENRAAVGGKKY